MKSTYLISTLLNYQVQATIFTIGSSQTTYTTPNVLYNANVVQNGDTIDIEADDYIGHDALAVWNQNDLLIRGIGGRPHLKANGAYIFGKGIWVLVGNNITVENIEFSKAEVPSENGAGIRLDGSGMTLRHCYFHHNENGILTNNTYAGHIFIEHCEFAYNGFGDGFTHNLYIGHCDKLTFQYNYSHHADIGHNLKSRADENIILYNRIMDEDTGNSSRLIDLSNGGFALVMGNLFMQGPNAENNNLISFGLEGLSNIGPHEIFVVNNTMINKRTASCIFLDFNSSATVREASNNIFAGTGVLSSNSLTASNNNYMDSNIANLQFEDEPSYNYHLEFDSPVIDGGLSLGTAGSYSLTPDFAYVHPVNYVDRLINGSLDIGAYEFPNTSHISSVHNAINVWPNPFNDVVIVNGDLSNMNVQVLDAGGQVVADYSASSSPITIDLNGLGAGTYFIRIASTIYSELSVRKIIKM